MTLQKIYDEQKREITARLDEFLDLWFFGTDEELFTEMTFCVCTPQTKAHNGWNAAKELKDSKLLFTGNQEEIGQILKKNGVRFHNNKSRYIIENRTKFYPNTKAKLLSFRGPLIRRRERLVKEVKGWGYKETSHFLRNIGFGKKICILDRHILRTLKEEGVIDEIPSNVGKMYMEIEQKMIDFSKMIDIPLPALDLVIWYKVNNEIFK